MAVENDKVKERNNLGIEKVHCYYFDEGNLQEVIVVVVSHISAHWLPTRKKLLYTVANPARGLLNREKKKKKKSGSAPPPPPARALLVRRKNENNKRKIRKSRGASTCLGATKAGVTQVVSVRLASVQGFLRLVS